MRPASALPESTRLEGVVEFEVGEGGEGGTAVGCAVGVGDGKALEGGVAEQVERWRPEG
jgi:hypothetical protein